MFRNQDLHNPLLLGFKVSSSSVVRRGNPVDSFRENDRPPPTLVRLPIHLTLGLVAVAHGDLAVFRLALGEFDVFLATLLPGSGMVSRMTLPSRRGLAPRSNRAGPFTALFARQNGV